MPDQSKTHSGLLTELLARMNKPMLPEVSKSGRALEQEVSRPRLSDADSPLLASLRGFGAGALKGMGDLSASYTSPLSVATLASGPLAKMAGTAAAAEGAAAPVADAVKTGSRLEQGGFKLPEPAVMPTGTRMAELYKKFGMVDPSSTYSTDVLEQLLNGR